MTHTFEKPGTYTVTLNVTDSVGATDTATLSLEVESVVLWLPLGMGTATGVTGIAAWWRYSGSDDDSEPDIGTPTPPSPESASTNDTQADTATPNGSRDGADSPAPAEQLRDALEMLRSRLDDADELIDAGELDAAEDRVESVVHGSGSGISDYLSLIINDNCVGDELFSV